MSHDRDRPEWADVTAWQERENERRARAVAAEQPIAHWASDAKWDLSDYKVVLDFEGRNIRNRGKRHQLIQRHFKVSAARYYQRLLQVLAMPEALEYDPVLVHRLINDQNNASRLRSTP